jgi:hypothetical protein
MNPETEARLKEIEARAEAASKGPWEAGEFYYPEEGKIGVCEITQYGEMGILAHAYLPAKGRDAYQEGRDNAVFMAASRQDIPFLLGLIREREKGVKPLKRVFVEDYSEFTISEYICECGEEVTEYFNFCPSCGVKLEWKASER